MKGEKEILEILENARPKLQTSSRDELWKQIQSQAQITLVVSPYYSMFLPYKKYVAVCLVVLIVVSGGGTAYAGNQARPGERLFVVDKALEQVELTLMPTPALKEKVRTRHADERLFELREIVASSVEEYERIPQLDDVANEILRFAEDNYFDDTKKGEFIRKAVREVGEERSEKYGFSKVRLRDDDVRVDIQKDNEDVERGIERRESEPHTRIEEKRGDVRSKKSGGGTDSDDNN